MQRPMRRLASALPALSVHHQLCRLSSQPLCSLSSSRLTFHPSLHPTHLPHPPHSTRAFHASLPRCRAPDPYAVLGVPRTATKDEIKLAYYRLAKAHHPDTNTTTTPTTASASATAAADKFHRVQAAYETLSDAAKKSAYDRSGSTGGGGGGDGEEWNSWYEDMNKAQRAGAAGMGGMGMGGGGGGGRRGKSWMEFDAEDFIHDLFGSWKGYGARSSSVQPRRTKGADLQSDMTLSFLDAVHGTTKTIAYAVDDACAACHASGKQPAGKKKHCSACQGKGYRIVGLDRSMRARVECDECGGEGRLWPLCGGCGGSGVVKEQRQVEVKIPAGVSENTNVRLLGMGDAGKRGGKRGNLRIRIHIADDVAGRRRDGCDIHSDLQLSLPQAILGLDTSVQTVHGAERLHVPSGVQHGAVLRVKGRGVRALNGSSGEQGDHVVHMHVRIPGQADMSDEQVDMMRQWAVAQQAQQAQQQARDEADKSSKQRAQQQQHGEQRGAGSAPEVERLDTVKQHENERAARREEKRKNSMGKSKAGMRKPRSRAVWEDDDFDDEDDEDLDEAEAEWEAEVAENEAEGARIQSKKKRRQRGRS